MRKCTAVAMAFLMLALTAWGGDALRPLNVSLQPHNHGLPNFIMEKEGLLEKAGLDVNFLVFASGPPQNEALGAGEWDVGAMGGPPGIAGAIAYDTHIIGLAADDTPACDYWVRPDSPIAKITGKVEGAPDILGDAASWRGKTILCPTATSAHFMLIATLHRLGLTEDDVNIIHMDVPQAFTAFKAGHGDIVSLWDPQSVFAKDEGWVRVSSGPASGERMFCVIVASENAVKKRPNEILDWLRLYYEVCAKYKALPDETEEYLLQFQKENGMQVDRRTARVIVEERTMPTLEDQERMFAGEIGKREVDVIMNNVLDYFIAQGRYEPKDKERLLARNYIDDTFIKKLIAEKKK